MKAYEMPIDCGLLGTVDALIYMIGPTITHVYLRLGSGVLVDVHFKLSDRVLDNIKSACESSEYFIETTQEKQKQ